MANDPHDFKQFMKQREQAAESYVSGEAGPLDQIATREGPATFFAPKGGYTQGSRNVSERYLNDAGSFASGSVSRFEILHMGASGELGYWVGLQHATVNMKGNDEPVPFHLRITELYRREGSQWKLIHRHADPHAEPSQ